MGAKIAKRYFSHILIRFQRNFMTNIIVMGEYRLLLSLVICQKLKMFWHFEFFVNTGPYGTGNFKNAAPPTLFIRCQPNFKRTLATMVEYSLLLFLAIDQLLTILWHFEILTLESIGKPNVWNISKTHDRKVKRTKI